MILGGATGFCLSSTGAGGGGDESRASKKDPERGEGEEESPVIGLAFSHRWDLDRPAGAEGGAMGDKGEEEQGAAGRGEAGEVAGI